MSIHCLFHIRRIACMTAACLPLAPVFAQGDAPVRPAETQPVGVRLESTPTRIDPLSIEFYLPVGATAETTSFGMNATMGVELPEGLGVMVVKGQRTTNERLEVRQVVDSIIDQLRRPRERSVPDPSIELLERDTNLVVDGMPGERFYMSFPGGGGAPAMTRGFAVFQMEPRHFLIFDLMTETAMFPTARRLFETTVGTVDRSDRNALEARRAAGIENMLGVLASVTPDRLRAIAERYPERWERLHSPAASGDEMDATEHGYRRVRIKWGMRGDMTGKQERNWRAADRVEGLIVQLDAMAIEPALRVDTRATYFVAFDDSAEGWTISMALRQGDAVSESSVTGARDGSSITVQLEQEGTKPTVTRPVIQGDGYLSQALSHVIGAILVDAAQPGEYASYTYSTASNTIVLRWDQVRQPPEHPGMWVIRTRTGENSPASEHHYNARGEYMRTVLHNGRLWEPIELDRLVKLWERKGLPLQ